MLCHSWFRKVCLLLLTDKRESKPKTIAHQHYQQHLQDCSKVLRLKKCTDIKKRGGLKLRCLLSLIQFIDEDSFGVHLLTGIFSKELIKIAGKNEQISCWYDSFWSLGLPEWLLTPKHIKSTSAFNKTITKCHYIPKLLRSKNITYCYLLFYL